MRLSVTNHRRLWSLVIVAAFGFAMAVLLIFAFQKSKAASIVNYEDAKEIEDIIITYHSQMNEFFNKKMEDFMKLKTIAELKQNDQLPEPRFKEDGSPNLALCGNNTSTWCVSMLMAEDFFDFKERVLSAREKITNDISQLRSRAEIQKQKAGRDKASKAFQSEYNDLATQLQKVDAMIEKETGLAQKTMELALAAYNELHVSWAIHTKNLEFIDLLEDYRNVLSGNALNRGIRNQIEAYPATFFNAQSAKCT